MKQRKRIYLIFILLLSMIVTSSCTNKVEKDTNSNNKIEVVDSLGRKVIIDKEVKRVATFYPLAGHVVTMLDRGIDIVAVSQGLKRDVLLAELNPSINNAVVAGSGREVNVETLMEQKPDLIIVTTNMAENEGEKSKLDNSQIPYIVIDYNNMKEQQEVISIIGKALGREEKAEKYNKFYKDTINLVETRVKDIEDSDKVSVFHSISEATRTEAKDTISFDWIKTAGLRNVIEDEKLNLFENSKYFASLEQLYIWDPDAFLVHDKSTEEYIMTDDKWEGLNAVKNNNIYILPIGISRWGHISSIEIPLALLWTGQTFYPKEFKDIDLNQKIKDYYEDFFDFQVSDQQIQSILAGEGMRLDKRKQNQ